ncbi:39S ribosomal protein L53, mitochondrial [Sitophilus oryzae]|uniref:Large ribosomal subunit protein mL53 n=1 Tax=Sitophilus oryzae TaxID=7048 RepID=A0A6J2YVL5_SITOR|nr:39S ribosomal protein L53, mitochondrial [Sitophilus oryzae]
MSIYFSGSLTRSAGLISAICKQLNAVNLQPVKKIQVQFDPFHHNAVTARDFLFHITSSKVQQTNLNCSIKTNVVSDRSEPYIKIDLIENGSVKFLLNNLTVLEVLQGINKHISSKVPKEEISTASTAITKTKKLSVKKLNKRR